MSHNADKPHDHPHAAKAAQAAPIGKGWGRFRVAMMDYANEESEVGRAVDGIAGIRALTFQLGQRSLAMGAGGPTVAIRPRQRPVLKPPFSLRPGVGAALGAALLSGASSPLAKLLLDGTSQRLLAVLLYLGFGSGLTILRVSRSEDGM